MVRQWPPKHESMNGGYAVPLAVVPDGNMFTCKMSRIPFQEYIELVILA